MEDFSGYIDTSYDSEFKQLADQKLLSWYPWVGDRYQHANSRVLFVLESAYKNESNKNTIGTLDFERQSIHEVFIEGATYSRTFNTIRNFGRELVSPQNIPSNVLWRSLAYHNIIQRPMDYTQNHREQPAPTDYANGLPVFKRILEILRPTLCICMGVKLANYLLTDKNFAPAITRRRPTEPGKIGSVYKREILNVKTDSVETGLIFTAHPRCKNHKSWADYVRKYAMNGTPLLG